ncbi:hypothetical protein D3C81_1236590 [compost metagenome]
MNTTDNAYGTRDERAYLAELARSPNAATLLSNYIASSEKRVVWGMIDKTEVLLYAQLLLGNAGAAEKADTTVRRAA